MHPDPYFERIGFRGSTRPDVATLTALHRAHVTSVPFENLDVQFQHPVSIGIEAAYDKIVGRRRGGWCYEQNGLFGWALARIGFRVTRVAGAVMRHERGTIADANHLCLLVNLPGQPRPFLADVGFGGSLLSPVPLEATEEHQPPFRIGIERLPNAGWRYWEDPGSGRFSYDFSPQPADETALAAKSEMLQSDPESPFVLNAVVQRRTPSRHVALRGRVFRETAADGITERLIGSADEYVTVLDRVFGLDVPQAASLWRRIVKRHDCLPRQESAS